ncbi:MAG: 3-dehydroquinate synthase, partial [Candidatus Ruthia sp.]|nr:3-dehydroquinate synthase [Candidatus Ruthturnera sp.]
PISISGKITASDFMAAMSVDKKVIDGNIRLILLKKLGDAFICDDYQSQLLDQVINEFCQ